jgi:hypothetical protein
MYNLKKKVMKNLKMIENLKNEGLVFVDNGEYEYERFLLKLNENEEVLVVDLECDEFEEDLFNKNLGKKNVIEFIEKGIEMGVFEMDEENDSVVYFDMDDDYINEFLD